MGKSNSKEENFNQLWQGVWEVKETLDKLTNAQNEKLEKYGDSCVAASPP